MEWKSKDADPTTDYRVVSKEAVTMTSGDDTSVTFSPPFDTAPVFIGAGDTSGTTSKNITAISVTTSGATLTTPYTGSNDLTVDATFAGE